MQILYKYLLNIELLPEIKNRVNEFSNHFY